MVYKTLQLCFYHYLQHVPVPGLPVWNTHNNHTICLKDCREVNLNAIMVRCFERWFYGTSSPPSPWLCTITNTPTDALRVPLPQLSTPRWPTLNRKRHYTRMQRLVIELLDLDGFFKTAYRPSRPAHQKALPLLPSHIWPFIWHSRWHKGGGTDLKSRRLGLQRRNR